MAHKVNVGGTAYEISGGKTLVNGTAYSIDKGKTLVGGTAYEVGFDDGIRTITVVYEGGENGLTHNGDWYSHNASFEANVGDVINCWAECYGEGEYFCWVDINGVTVAHETAGGYNGNREEAGIEYDYTVSTDAVIYLVGDGDYESMDSGVEIYEIHNDPSTITLTKQLDSLAGTITYGDQTGSEIQVPTGAIIRVGGGMYSYQNSSVAGGVAVTYSGWTINGVDRGTTKDRFLKVFGNMTVAATLKVLGVPPSKPTTALQTSHLTITGVCREATYAEYSAQFT